MTQALPVRHALLALAVVAVWGTNFVVIKTALGTLPPLLLAALRFALALLPALLWVPRPAVPWRKLASYGVLIGAGQFGLLYMSSSPLPRPCGPTVNACAASSGRRCCWPRRASW